MKKRVGRKLIHVNAKVDQNDVSQLDAIAEREGLNRSDIVRRAVKNFLSNCQVQKTEVLKNSQYAA